MSAFIGKIINIDYKIHLVVALVIRFSLIAYGVYHDKNNTVKYTDVDYKVFTDASRHVLNNRSPYSRHTYRYTPLVAIALIPNLIFHPCFGKVLFCFVDILVALFIKSIVKYNLENYQKYLFSENVEDRNELKYKKSEEFKSKVNISILTWLYNPMTIAIGTRGNCDSLAGFFVLLSIYFLQCQNKPFIAGLLHGFSIHFRLYPIIYSLTMFMYLSSYSFYTTEDRRVKKRCTQSIEGRKFKELDNKSKDVLLQNNQVLVESNPVERKTIFKKKYLFYLIPNWEQIKLVTGCILSLTILTYLFYYLYGYNFLHETYIYHFVRKDTRHNFSLYFYLLYLTAWVKNIGMWQNVLIVFPQVLLLIVFSVRFGLNKFCLNFAILTQTIVFVIYNTVLTSQYFVWIMAILPLCLWQIKISAKSALLLLMVWFVAQVAWLLPAYYLEFQGQNTFMLIWIQSVSLFCANIAILGRMIMYFMPLDKVKSE